MTEGVRSAHLRNVLCRWAEYVHLRNGRVRVRVRVRLQNNDERVRHWASTVPVPPRAGLGGDGARAVLEDGVLPPRVGRVRRGEAPAEEVPRSGGGETLFDAVQSFAPIVLTQKQGTHFCLHSQQCRVWGDSRGADSCPHRHSCILVGCRPEVPIWETVPNHII